MLARRFMESLQITSRFGASVRNFRHGMGISQEALAERADLHRTYIADIERGARNVTLKSIEKLARALQVSIPTLLSDSGGPAGRSESPNAKLTKGKSADILMAEDNPDDVELTMRAFARARITNPLQVVRDGKEALDFLFHEGRYARHQMEDRPSLILLDLSLPKVSGLDVLRRIKADRRTCMIPVVVLTNSRLFNDLDECQRLGVKTYIVKPPNFEGFAAAVLELGMYWQLLDQSPKL